MLYCIFMSIRSEFENFKEVLKPPLKPLLYGILLFQSGNILEAISDSTLQRNSFPEPFDIASHIGNFREAAMTTAGAYAMIGIVTLTAPLIDKSRELIRCKSKQTAIAAFAVSSAVQVLGEKFEITNSLYAPNTGDPLDAAYGIAWSAAIAVGAYKLLESTEQSYYDRNQEIVDSQSLNAEDTI